MNINDYFDPLDIKVNKKKGNISYFFDFYNEDFSFDAKKYQLVLFSINVNNNDDLFENIRNNFYFLSDNVVNPFKAIDLGNLKKGNTFSDTLFATRDVCEYFLSNKIIPIIISDNWYISYGLYLAFESLNKTVSFSIVDYTVKLQKKDQNFLNQILSRENNTLFNNTFIGIQNFYTKQKDIKSALSNGFELVRLGDIQANIRKVEPYIRDSDVLLINTKSLINAFLDEYNTFSPSGLLHKEACQITRYAGISEKMSTFVLYVDKLIQIPAMSYAQILWYFIEGYTSRKGDFPVLPFSKLIKYHVEVSKNTFITFYKSPLTERLWIEVPIPQANYEKSWLLSCDEQDYQHACKGIIPDRWHKYLKKLF